VEGEGWSRGRKTPQVDCVVGGEVAISSAQTKWKEKLILKGKSTCITGRRKKQDMLDFQPHTRSLTGRLQENSGEDKGFKLKKTKTTSKGKFNITPFPQNHTQSIVLQIGAREPSGSRRQKEWPQRKKVRLYQVLPGKEE